MLFLECQTICHIYSLPDLLDEIPWGIIRGVKITWLMGDVGGFALMLCNRSPGGVGAQLPCSWSSDRDF